MLDSINVSTSQTLSSSTACVPLTFLSAGAGSSVSRTRRLPCAKTVHRQPSAAAAAAAAGAVPAAASRPAQSGAASTSSESGSSATTTGAECLRRASSSSLRLASLQHITTEAAIAAGKNRLHA
jgi:hypothetical protein